ncbi:MAG: hypothetical protein WCX81_03420 [Monoglobales bacterium]
MADYNPPQYSICGYGGIGSIFAERCQWQIKRGENDAAVDFS